MGLTGTPPFAALTGHTFFTLQHFFCKVIPQIATPAGPLMHAVKALVAKGGNDLAANVPNEAFRNWCAVDLGRARAIVNAAERGDALSIAFVTFALHALGDVALARSFVTNYSDEGRLSGLFVLGLIKPADVKEAEDTIAVLLPIVGAEQDDVARGNALISVLNICKQFPALASVSVPKVISNGTVTPGPMVLLNLAQALWLHVPLMDRTSAKSALNALKATDPAHGGIIHNLDIALNTLLMTPNGDLALDLLTDVLSRGDGSFGLEQFESIKHELATGDRDRLFRLLVRWLLTGNAQLCSSAPKFLSTGERAVPFDTSTARMGLTDADHMFLAYKTLGWLFTIDVVAASTRA